MRNAELKLDLSEFENPNPDETVISPKRWFAGESSDTPDLFPASWVKP